MRIGDSRSFVEIPPTDEDGFFTCDLCDCDEYAVRVNAAGGACEIVPCCEEHRSDYRSTSGHFTEWFYGTLQKCKSFIEEEQRRTKKYAVFVDKFNRKATYEEVNCFSGNYKGSLYYPYSYDSEYNTEEEAQEKVKEELTYAGKTC